MSEPQLSIRVKFAKPPQGSGDPAAMMRPQSGGGNAAEADKIAGMTIAPDMVQFEYSYAGDLPPLTAETVGVLARQKDGTRLPIESLLSRLNIDQIDLASFDGANVESINFTQDTQMGYAFYVNLKEGTVAISPQWDKWPQPGANCKDEACFRALQLQPSDIPSDETLLSIADAFVKDHGIDVTKYGKPEIDKTWVRDYERAEDKQYAYVPDVQRVIYPLLINDQPVYEEGGVKAGISVGVNVREKKAADVWGIMNNSYLESQYPAVKDEAAIRQFIQKVDVFPKEFQPEGSTTRTIKVELGEPVVAYTRIYKYEQNQSQELVVPALVFPVKAPEGKDKPWRQSITVPLAQEMLEERQNVGRPMPVDLIR
jgi:hypothetical protein